MENKSEHQENWKPRILLELETEAKELSKEIEILEKNLLEVNNNSKKENNDIKKNINNKRNELNRKYSEIEEIELNLNDYWNEYINRNIELENLIKAGKYKDGPISFSKYKEIGMSWEQYKYYIRCCEELRCFCIANEFKNNIELIKLGFDKIVDFFEHLIGYTYVKYDNYPYILSGINVHKYTNYMARFYKLDIDNIERFDGTIESLDQNSFGKHIYVDLDSFRRTLEFFIRSIINSNESGKSVIEYGNEFDDTAYIAYSEEKFNKIESKIKKFKYYWDAKCELNIKKKNFDEIMYPYLYELPPEPIDADEQEYNDWVNSIVNIMKEIDEYEELESEIEFLEEFVTKLESSSEIQNILENDTLNTLEFAKEPIYIYKTYMKCYKENHKVKSTRAIVENIKGKLVELSVDYCTECKIYAIDIASLEAYEKIYGILLFYRKIDIDFKSNSEFNRSDYSPLRLYGYSVKEGAMTENERQKLLVKIIEKEWLSKYKITNYLNLFINTNGESDKNVNARNKWRDDLIFLRNLPCDDNNLIAGRLVRL